MHIRHSSAQVAKIAPSYPDRDDVAHMGLAELDDLRHGLRLSKRELCRRAGIAPSTYQRWMGHLNDPHIGCSPQPRSLRAIRDALGDVLASRAAIETTCVAVAAE